MCDDLQYARVCDSAVDLSVGEFTFLRVERASIHWRLQLLMCLPVT